MTAVREQAPPASPRVFVRIAWVLHRAYYRLTGGRRGLWRPKAGAKFGTMRLTTLGRRSGQPRVAIVGYYEDGENLVTLAMNGWAEAEPAWWLNLQAQPETVVELKDGPRAVRARVAAGAERERLWASFRDYPGWGDDVEGLAARRPRPTAVVVLEPRDVAAETDTYRTDAPDRARASAVSRARGAGSAAAEQVTGPRLRVRRRYVWLVPGIGLALFANAQASPLGVGLVPLLVFGIVPDLPRFVGLRQPAMLMLHNAMHQPALALAVLIGSAVTGMSPFAYVGALAWLGHIVVGWGTGDRLRSADAQATTEPRGLHRGDFALAPEAARSSAR